MGFRKGALLTHKQTKEQTDASKNGLDVQYELVYINDDGSIGMKQIRRNGALMDEVTIVKLEGIMNFSVIRPEQRLNISTLGQPPAVGFDFYVAIADIALGAAHAKHFTDPKDVYVTLVPKARLMALRPLKAKELTLVPWTQSASRKPMQKDSTATLFVQVCVDPPVCFEINTPIGLGKNFEVP